MPAAVAVIRGDYYLAVVHDDLAPRVGDGTDQIRPFGVKAQIVLASHGGVDIEVLAVPARAVKFLVEGIGPSGCRQRPLTFQRPIIRFFSQALQVILDIRLLDGP